MQDVRDLLDVLYLLTMIPSCPKMQLVRAWHVLFDLRHSLCLCDVKCLQKILVYILIASKHRCFLKYSALFPPDLPLLIVFFLQFALLAGCDWNCFCTCWAKQALQLTSRWASAVCKGRVWGIGCTQRATRKETEGRHRFGRCRRGFGPTHGRTRGPTCGRTWDPTCGPTCGSIWHFNCGPRATNGRC